MFHRRPLTAALRTPPLTCSARCSARATQRVPEQVVAADPVAIPLLQRFTSVRVHDSTTISLPDVLTSTWRGCGNGTDRGTAGLKCGVQIDLLTGALCGLDLVDGRSSDHMLPVRGPSG